MGSTNTKTKLTPTLRAFHEGQKNARTRTQELQQHYTGKTGLDLQETRQFKLKNPEEYIKVISIDEEITLGKFFEKIIALGSTQGFVSFMMLYQYMYDSNLLGKEVEYITGQEIMNHIYGTKRYTLTPKNKQRFLTSILQLSGLQFYLKDAEETKKTRHIPGNETNVVFTSFTLLKVKSFETLADQQTVTNIRKVSIMKDFIQLWFNKMSRLLIPLHDILLIPHDFNKDHRRGFNLSLALRHAELGSKKDYVEWDLQQCLNVGQWAVSAERKKQAWEKVIESLEAGKQQQLIDYYFIYKPNKPQEMRYIKKVVIKRLWQTHAETFMINFKPEEIKPYTRKKTTVKAHNFV